MLGNYSIGETSICGQYFVSVKSSIIFPMGNPVIIVGNLIPSILTGRLERANITGNLIPTIMDGNLIPLALNGNNKDTIVRN